MAYRIEFTPSASKDYRSIRSASLKDKIANALEEIAKSPRESGKALKASLAGFYSYRVGKYRIVYEIVKKERIVVVLRIKRRRDVYR